MSGSLVCTCVEFKMPRTSADADIELNPGPGAWADDPIGNGMRAALGGSLHQYDVRSVLIASGMPLSLIDERFQHYTSVEACAGYYRQVALKVGGYPLGPAGESPAAVARAFRAVYVSLRDDYIRGLLLQHPSEPAATAAMCSFPTHAEVGCERDQWASEARSEHLALTEASEPARLDVSKVWCDVCCFNVNPDGHELRCRPSGVKSVSNSVRVAAWVGDAVHTVDVRVALVRERLSVRKLTRVCDWYKSAREQAKYLRRVLAQSDCEVMGASSHSVSTVFESLYHGTFRDRYLDYLVDSVAEVVDSETRDDYDSDAVLNPFVG